MSQDHSNKQMQCDGRMTVTSPAQHQPELRGTMMPGKQAPGFPGHECGVGNSSEAPLTDKTGTKILFKIRSPQYLLPDYSFCLCAYRCIVYAQMCVHG